MEIISVIIYEEAPEFFLLGLEFKFYGVNGTSYLKSEHRFAARYSEDFARKKAEELRDIFSALTNNAKIRIEKRHIF